MQTISKLEINAGISFLIYLPFLLCATVLFWHPKGINSLPPIIIGTSLITAILLRKNIFTFIYLRHKPYIWLLSAYGMYCLFSYFYHGHSSRELRALSYCILFVYFISRFPINRKVISLTLILSSLGITIITIYQYFYLSVHRIHGFTNPNIFVIYCATIAISCFCMAIDKNIIHNRILLSFCFILTLSATILTGSRGTIISLITAILVTFVITYYKSKHLKKMLIASLIFIIIVVTAFAFIKPRIHLTVHEINLIRSGSYESSIGIRFQLWTAAMNIIRSSPFFGVGDTYKSKLEKSFDEGIISKKALQQNHFHNQILDTMVKKGAVGTILLLTILFYPLVNSIRQKEGGWRSNFAVGLFLIYFVSGFSDVPLNHPQIIYLYIIFLNTIYFSKTYRKTV
jgi:O-antigen ligase